MLGCRKKVGVLQENPPADVRYSSTYKNSGLTSPGIEFRSPRWEAVCLATLILHLRLRRPTAGCKQPGTAVTSIPLIPKVVYIDPQGLNPTRKGSMVSYQDTFVLVRENTNISASAITCKKSTTKVFRVQYLLYFVKEVSWGNAQLISISEHESAHPVSRFVSCRLFRIVIECRKKRIVFDLHDVPVFREVRARISELPSNIPACCAHTRSSNDCPDLYQNFARTAQTFLSNDAMKPSKLDDHLRRCHPDKTGKDFKYFQTMKEKLQKRPTVVSIFASTSKSNDDGLRASYNTSLLIAKSGKPPTIGEQLIFPAIEAFPNLSQTNCQDGDVSAYVQHLDVLHTDFETRFDNVLTMEIPQWTINPYGDTEETDVILQGELIGISTNEELKVQFRKGYQQFWLQRDIPVTYPALWTIARKFLIAFPSSYLVKRGFSEDALECGIPFHTECMSRKLTLSLGHKYLVGSTQRTSTGMPEQEVLSGQPHSANSQSDCARALLGCESTSSERKTGNLEGIKGIFRLEKGQIGGKREFLREFISLVMSSKMAAEAPKPGATCARIGRGKREIPEKNIRTLSSGTIPTCENPATLPGIEPCSLWWEASRLTT
ncbi:hypothetical protein PR048_011806 [Dryococelus australis]|uniref:SCAN domain-containing protein 3 n=1 Tax=Dryococelus australis TaxID=614101 RepID=A0ABQ9HNX3_9NEOP|nr:hypothetical protein PR048_011806 [Dryococelus australis]